jgi:Ser/Thr protein kinase RdoA (MazF antagonist)
MSKEDFYNLTPDGVMRALETVGLNPTGEFTQLNSYENRVFDIRLEVAPRDATNRVVTKFYRPGRWSKETILAEHEFLSDLVANGLPAVAPLHLRSSPRQPASTLALHENMWFTVFPKAVGRMVDELNLNDLKRLGRTMARLHNIGEQKSAPTRPILTAEKYGFENLPILEPVVAPEVADRYFDAAEHILEYLSEELDQRRAKSFVRIHGDCHRGNILKSDPGSDVSEFFFIDFDDFCMGPPVQDFWMLLSDDESSSSGADELDHLLEGYSEFRHFDSKDLELIPALRGLRLIHYAAWIARRWEDPSFPRLFPQFTEFNYWASETEALEKLAHRI